jgi:hypothetical protein
MIEPKENQQERFFAILESLCPPNMTLADILVDVLKISKDSAYRRIRSETFINMNELYLLSRYFNISIDYVLSYKSNIVAFEYSQMRSIEDYKNYLRSIIKDINTLIKYENVRVIYAAQDIPLFHNFRSRKLAQFKLFYWLRSIVNSEEFQEKNSTRQILMKNCFRWGMNYIMHMLMFLPKRYGQKYPRKSF